MRQHTASLEAFGGDHVSTEHLKQALYRRMMALEDDPTVPLFFGRLDYDATSAPSRTRPSTSGAGMSPARQVASRW